MNGRGSTFEDSELRVEVLVVALTIRLPTLSPNQLSTVLQEKCSDDVNYVFLHGERVFKLKSSAKVTTFLAEDFSGSEPKRELSQSCTNNERVSSNYAKAHRDVSKKKKSCAKKNCCYGK